MAEESLAQVGRLIADRTSQNDFDDSQADLDVLDAERDVTEGGFRFIDELAASEFIEVTLLAGTQTDVAIAGRLESVGHSQFVVQAARSQWIVWTSAVATASLSGRREGAPDEHVTQRALLREMRARTTGGVVVHLRSGGTVLGRLMRTSSDHLVVSKELGSSATSLTLVVPFSAIAAVASTRDFGMAD